MCFRPVNPTCYVVGRLFRSLLSHFHRIVVLEELLQTLFHPVQHLSFNSGRFLLAAHVHVESVVIWILLVESKHFEVVFVVR